MQPEDWQRKDKGTNELTAPLVHSQATPEEGASQRGTSPWFSSCTRASGRLSSSEFALVFVSAELALDSCHPASPLRRKLRSVIQAAIAPRSKKVAAENTHSGYSSRGSVKDNVKKKNGFASNGARTRSGRVAH